MKLRPRLCYVYICTRENCHVYIILDVSTRHENWISKIKEKIVMFI
jgi:hypothetical protein